MKIFIVKHTHMTENRETDYCENTSVHISRENAEKSLRKCWKGTDGKITQEEAENFMGKLPRMNQDQRDALLLAWVYAGLAVKVKPRNAKLS